MENINEFGAYALDLVKLHGPKFVSALIALATSSRGNNSGGLRFESGFSYQPSASASVSAY